METVVVVAVLLVAEEAVQAVLEVVLGVKLLHKQILY
jgi:hypothetical protein